MKLLKKEDILKAADLKREAVRVPEWGGSVYVRMMTGAERDSFDSLFTQSGRKTFRSVLVAHTACDEQGNLLFTVDDVEELAKKSAAALDRICVAATKINAITDEDVKELEKNS